MAKVLEEVIVIKLSKLIKENGVEQSLITPDVMGALEQVAQELVGENIIVEVEKA